MKAFNVVKKNDYVTEWYQQEQYGVTSMSCSCWLLLDFHICSNIPFKFQHYIIVQEWWKYIWMRVFSIEWNWTCNNEFVLNLVKRRHNFYCWIQSISGDEMLVYEYLEIQWLNDLLRIERERKSYNLRPKRRWYSTPQLMPEFQNVFMKFFVLN